MSVTFQKATKSQLKARIALDGPSGAGKTWTGLTIASRLGKRVCWIDSERRSGSLYADHFDFDTFAFDPPYDPAKLVDVLRAAEAEGYDVIGIDSLSHFWEGEGGVLDIVDRAGQSKFGGNKYMGWSVGTPALRRLVDIMLSLDAHLIVSMRSKMDYVEEENARGKKGYVKVGMAPVMRGGIEYEFTLVGDMDLEHRLTISKSRCDLVADKVYIAGAAGDFADEFLGWLESGEPMVTRDQVAEIRAILDSIDAGRDSARRGDAKRMWKERFGDPVALVGSSFAAAKHYAQELAGVEVDEGLVAAPPPVAAPETASAPVPTPAPTTAPAPPVDDLFENEPPAPAVATAVEPPPHAAEPPPATTARRRSYRTPREPRGSGDGARTVAAAADPVNTIGDERCRELVTKAAEHFPERAARLLAASNVLARPIESFKDLTNQEGNVVTRWLHDLGPTSDFPAPQGQYDPDEEPF